MILFGLPVSVKRNLSVSHSAHHLHAHCGSLSDVLFISPPVLSVRRSCTSSREFPSLLLREFTRCPRHPRRAMMGRNAHSRHHSRSHRASQYVQLLPTLHGPIRRQFVAVADGRTHVPIQLHPQPTNRTVLPRMPFIPRLVIRCPHQTGTVRGAGGSPTVYITRRRIVIGPTGIATHSLPCRYHPLVEIRSPLMAGCHGAEPERRGVRS